MVVVVALGANTAFGKFASATTLGHLLATCDSGGSDGVADRNPDAHRPTDGSHDLCDGDAEQVRTTCFALAVRQLRSATCGSITET